MLDVCTTRLCLHLLRLTRNYFPSLVGFMAEAESLITVSAGASHDRMRNAPAARAMLSKLHNETSIFGSKNPPPERYLFIMVRAEGVPVLMTFQLNLRPKKTQVISTVLFALDVVIWVRRRPLPPCMFVRSNLVLQVKKNWSPWTFSGHDPSLDPTMMFCIQI